LFVSGSWRQRKVFCASNLLSSSDMSIHSWEMITLCGVMKAKFQVVYKSRWWRENHWFCILCIKVEVLIWKNQNCQFCKRKAGMF
jgi:hypothetical protein